MGIPKDYNVEVVKREVVIPATVIQEHVLPFSNIDLTVPPCGVHVFFCYDKPFQTSFVSVLSNLKSSLSRAFMSCSAFAGRLVSHGDGDLQMVCNGKGAEFSEAYADICLTQVEFCNPIAAIEGKLVPLLVKDSEGNGSPVFAVQVTKFSCGGIVVSCTFDHRIADSFSTNLFFTCWANLSRNEPIGFITPSFTRSILVPRDPPDCCSEIKKMYTKVQLFPQSNMQIPHPPITSRIYYLNAKDIEMLQQNANQNGNKYTKLEAFSAYLWKMLIQGQEIENTMNCNMGIVVDGRSHLTRMGMPTNYFGNVISLPFARARAKDIKKEPLSWSAKGTVGPPQVHCGATVPVVTCKYTQGLQVHCSHP
ncbi:coniferyl alcohol acyltransferase-like [Cryptomeria japonica]|uniref:coniferyl alcohol acyltransferase-like n=1 Tax=Cryptomeria japonica TaxID=3369 RepID=UPI0027DA9A7E|nr:coniferyl alcohol acyltransferase-like [Cryptomeria japonica]